MKPTKAHSAFTSLEVLVTIVMLVVALSFVIPMYRQYVIRNDLDIARQNVVQGLERARFLSQVSMNDSAWGFSTNAVPGKGVLYMGQSYALRSSDFDELYSIPDSITVTGIVDVSFSKIDGVPSQTGVVTLTAISGEQRSVSITIGTDGFISVPDDWLTICTDPYGDNPQTIQVPDSLWEVYSDQGAELGSCDGVTPPFSTSVGSSSVSAISFSIVGDTVIPNEQYTCSLKVLGAALQSAGQDLPITMRVEEDGTWEEPFGNWNLPVNSNLNSGAVHYADCISGSIPALTPLNIQARSWQKKRHWYSGTSNSHWVPYLTVVSTPESSGIEVLQDGDAIPPYEPLSSQSSIEDFLSQYMNLETGTVVLGANEVIYLIELGTTNYDSSAADFQDVVLLLTLEQPS